MRFDVTKAANPFGDLSYGLYVNADEELVFRSLTTSTVIGATGAGAGAPSLDAIFQGDQTLDLGALSTLTIDRSSGNNDVLTLTNTGAGSGDCIQITNVGTGNDIEGTSDTWHFSKAGDMTANMAVFAGDAGSDSITLTTGDMVITQGSFTITADDDNAATISATNDTATTASPFVFAGSGAFTGSTTSSWMTITPSGLTSGTGIYAPFAALTTGTGLHVVCNTVTSGKVVHIASSVTGATMTANGRLFYVEHTGTGTTSVGALAEIKSAAADETVITKITATAALATGKILHISGSSMTTGGGIIMSDLDSLTSGIGLHIASASTVLTGAGRLVYINHTGNATAATTAKIVEIASAAAEDSEIFKITASAALAAGIAANISVVAMTTGTALQISNLNALTTGKGANISSSATAITGAGRLLYVYHSGASSTSGTLVEFKTAATDETILCQLTTAAMVNGIALGITGTTGMTTGSLIRATTSTASAVATNGIYSFKATGAFTSTSNAGLVDIGASATTAGTVVHITSSAASQTATSLLNVVASGFTTGYTGDVVSFTGCSTTGAANVLKITSVNTTAGAAMTIVANAITTGEAFVIAHTTSVIANGGSIMNLSSSSVDTATTTGTILHLENTGSVAGVLMRIYSNLAAQTTTQLLNVTAAGYTTGYTGNVVSFVGCSTTGAGNVMNITAVNTSAGGALNIANNALTTGYGARITHTTAVIASGGSLLRVSSTSIDTSTTTGVLLDLSSTASTAGTQVLGTFSALETGIGMSLVAASATTGTLLKLTFPTSATGKYIQCYDGAADDFAVSRYGATTIAGNAAGTAALTITAGDILLSDGYINYKVDVETAASDDTITAAESGKTFFFSHATEFDLTLPAVAAGLHYKFIVGTAPDGDNYRILAPAGADLIHGCGASSADAGGSADCTAGTKADTITFVDGQAKEGDWVELVCDGTYWYAVAIAGDEDAITFTAA